jgi:hypothetical protein
MRFRILTVGAAATALTFIGAAPVFADPSIVVPDPASVSNVSDVKAGVVTVKGHNLRVAVVAFDYTCGGVGDLKHLFVAVKQGEDVNNTDHTSSSFADTFYSTNWRSDKNFNAITCDGVVHRARVVMGPDPFFRISGGPHPALSNGTALVQVCVYDNSGGPGGDEPSAADYNMHDVHVLGSTT